MTEPMGGRIDSGALTGGPLSRRGFLGGAAMVAAAAGLAPVLTACGGSSGGGSKSKSLTVRSTPGGSAGKANDGALFKPFEDKTGIKLSHTALGVTQLVESAKAGKPKADVVQLGSNDLLALHQAGALEPLDYSAFKGFSKGDLVNAVAHDTYIGCYIFTTVIAYRTDVFAAGHEMQGWADFWNLEAFPGKRGLPDMSTNDQPALEEALIADGVPVSSLYPLDIDRALDSMSRIRKAVPNFYPDSTHSATLLDQKEVVATTLSNGKTQVLIDAGKPVAIQWNQGMQRVESYGILKGTKHMDEALQFIDFAMQPQQQANFSKFVPYGPTNNKAFDLVDAKLAAVLPTNPKWQSTNFVRDDQWWADNVTKVQAAWTAWKLKG